MIAVLVYIFYTDVWEEILPLLSKLKDKVYIHIALCSDNDNSKILNDLKIFNIINVIYVENRGADIGPFLLQLQDIDESQYPYFIKLHSKKSVISKMDWKYILFNDLIGSESIVENNTAILQKNNSIGAITDPLVMMTNVGHNASHVEVLCKTLNIKNTNKKFMAGSMFMSRTDIFKKYFTKEFTDTIYPLLETGRVLDIYKGTYCHALERIFSKIIYNENLKIGYRREKPHMQIYNKKNRNLYSLYKCYNNYCYTKSKKALIFGYIYQIINDESVIIDWTYMKQYDHYFRRYNKRIDDYFVGVS